MKEPLRKDLQKILNRTEASMRKKLRIILLLFNIKWNIEKPGQAFMIFLTFLEILWCVSSPSTPQKAGTLKACSVAEKFQGHFTMMSFGKIK